MIPQPAARRYAEAAYLIAREEGTEDAWSTGLQAMASLFSDPDAQRFLSNTSVPPDQKRKLVETAIAGVDPKVVNLALLLLRRGRTHMGEQVAQAYQEIVDRQKGISHAVVTTAVPLTSDEQSDVEQKLRELAGGEVTIRTEVDESILGGLIVRIGDRLIDGSTRSKLVALKQRLEGVTA